jgi:hypothetical protein
MLQQAETAHQRRAMKGRSTEPKGASRAWNISMLASSCQIRKTARCEIATTRQAVCGSLKSRDVRRNGDWGNEVSSGGIQKQKVIWQTAERLAGESRRISSQAGKLHGIRKVTGYIWYIYLTAVGLTPGGSSTSHIYTQTVYKIQR